MSFRTWQKAVVFLPPNWDTHIPLQSMSEVHRLPKPMSMKTILNIFTLKRLIGDYHGYHYLYVRKGYVRIVKVPLEENTLTAWRGHLHACIRHIQSSRWCRNNWKRIQKCAKVRTGLLLGLNNSIHTIYHFTLYCFNRIVISLCFYWGFFVCLFVFQIFCKETQNLSEVIQYNINMYKT